MSSGILCNWLPVLVLLDDFDGNWETYDNYLYNIFKNDFIISKPLYLSKPVNIRKYPIIRGKEQAYFHVTSADTATPVDTNDRIPDLRRCERVPWIRKVIENYNCLGSCEGCSKIKIWPESYKGYLRWHFLFLDQNFIVVVEERGYYNLLISAFYIERDHQLRKKLKKFEDYIAKDA